MSQTEPAYWISALWQKKNSGWGGVKKSENDFRQSFSPFQPIWRNFDIVHFRPKKNPIWPLFSPCRLFNLEGEGFQKTKSYSWGGGDRKSENDFQSIFSPFQPFWSNFFFLLHFWPNFFSGLGGGINFVCIFLLVESNGASILNFSFLYAHITTSPDGRPAGWVVDCWRIRLNSARWGLTELGNYMFATDHRTFSCIEMLSQVQMKNSRMLLAVKDSLLRLFGSIYQSSHLSRRQSVWAKGRSHHKLSHVEN